MAEGSKDINQMIQQRHQRPAYARMISWEFSNVKEPRLKKKLRKKHASGPVNVQTAEGSPEMAEVDDCADIEDENEASASESSEYDTACEDEADISDLTMSQSGSFVTGSCSESIRNLTVDNSDDDSEVFGEHGPYPVDVSTVVSAADDQRRKKLTKRQKRRKRDEYKLIHANEFFVMGDLCDVDADIDNTLLEIGESQTIVDVERPVPSLVELCLRASRKKPRLRSKSSTSDPPKTGFSLPPGMRSVARTFGSQFKLQQMQLKVLQNHILPANGSMLVIENELNAFPDMREGKSLFLPVMSVWTQVAYPPEKPSGVTYPSSFNSAYLFALTYHCDSDWWDNITAPSWKCESFFSSYLKELLLILPAYATTMDLMLPGSVWSSRSPDPALTEDERMAKQIQLMTVRVKSALKLRFPVMTDMLFERMLPYVMWARGLVAMAAEMFHSLIRKETCKQYKAMYLSEIARMHAQFGDTDSATRLYKLAGETALEEGVNSEMRDTIINEVTEQTQVLLASVYDVGLLSETKAAQSSTHWGVARCLSSPKDATILCSFDSLLCYHAAYCKGDWLQEALTKLKDHQSKEPVLCYVSAMLLAFQGRASDSDNMYKAGRSSYFSDYLSSAAMLVKTERRVKNPFSPILDLVRKQKSPIKPLQVVWRCQLTPPSLQHARMMEGQVNKKKLHLRLDENGCVTGDLEMLLPPMRNISLNPYTGALVFNQIPSNTGTWYSPYLKKRCYHPQRLLPSPVLLFEHEDGTSVHMVTPGLYKKGPIPGSIMLYWRGSTGKPAQINLFNELKNSTKQRDLADLESQRGKMTEEKYNASLHCLELCYKQNLTNDVNSTANMARVYLQSLEKAKKKDHKKTKPKVNFKAYGNELNFQFSNDPFVFGKTILLHLDVSGGKKSFLVFINASSRDTFLKPVIEIKDISFWRIRHQGLRNRSDADFFLCYAGTKLAAYNQFGTCTFLNETEHLKRSEMPNDTFCPVVIGSKVFGLNTTSTSVWSHLIGTHFEIEGRRDKSAIFDSLCTWEIAPYWEQLAGPDDARVIHDLVVVGNQVKGTGHLLMVVMSVGLGFMDPETLAFVPIVQEEKAASHRDVLAGNFETTKLLEGKCYMREDRAVYLCGVAVQNKLLVFEISHRPDMQEDGVRVELLTNLVLPGAAVDMCFVGNGHMLVSVTHSNREVTYYREHIYLFSVDNYCKGALLSLGPGPRSFLPVYLHGNEEGQSAGWYVYMRDGHHGIIGVKLPC